MTRDMDLIRELLLKLEAWPIRRGGIAHIDPDEPDIAVTGYDGAQIEYHLTQLIKAGFIDDGGAHPMHGIGFRCLTWSGHDFLDTVRSPEVWRRTKAGAKEVGSWGVDLLWGLAKEYAKQVAKEKLGFQLP